jgi:hypothetical protein
MFAVVRVPQFSINSGGCGSGGSGGGTLKALFLHPLCHVFDVHRVSSADTNAALRAGELAAALLQSTAPGRNGQAGAHVRARIRAEACFRRAARAWDSAADNSGGRSAALGHELHLATASIDGNIKVGVKSYCVTLTYSLAPRRAARALSPLSRSRCL